MFNKKNELPEIEVSMANILMQIQTDIAFLKQKNAINPVTAFEAAHGNQMRTVDLTDFLDIMLAIGVIDKAAYDLGLKKVDEIVKNKNRMDTATLQAEMAQGQQSMMQNTMSPQNATQPPAQQPQSAYAQQMMYSPQQQMGYGMTPSDPNQMAEMMKQQMMGGMMGMMGTAMMGGMGAMNNGMMNAMGQPGQYPQQGMYSPQSNMYPQNNFYQQPPAQQ